jgi:hypothetical protein
MKLGELRPGDVFRSPSGALWVVLDGIGGGGKRRYQLLGPRGGLVVTTPGDTSVEPLDLSALLEEHALFRRLLADVGQDQGYTVGVWAERSAVVGMLEGELEKAARHCKDAMKEATSGGVGPNAVEVCVGVAAGVETVLAAVRARGLAATPDPPARLAERVQELEGALRGLLADAEAVGEYWHGTDPAEVLPSVLAARAALGTK